MRRRYLLAGLGVFSACLVGWVALAGAQSIQGVMHPVDPIAVASPAPAAVRTGVKMVNPPPAVILPASMPKGAPLRVPAPPSLGDGPGGEAPTPRIVNGAEAAPLVMGVQTPPASQPAPVGTPARMMQAGKMAMEEKPDSALEQMCGRQEPSVSLEWMGTPIAKVGQAADYSLVVRNQCATAVENVQVKVRIPNGLSIQKSEPKAAPDGGTLTWDLGTLAARQERVIRMRLHAETKGDSMPQAWVTFTGLAVIHIRAREPKLALRCSVADRVLLGDPAAITLTVSNPGDGSADHVKIHAKLSDGLESARGNKADFDIGNLSPGESRNVTLLCAAGVGGKQKCEATAEAEAGLSATDTARLTVIMPKLDLQLVGPHLRYLDRKAVYTLKVTNPGDAPAPNVTVSDVIPAGFKVLAASDGGRHDYQTRTVSWFLGELGPGKSREVKVEVQAASVGEHKHRATATGARGLRAECELMTHVEGLSAMLVELVDTEDPIEAGGDTSYEVRITNTGSKTETNIRVVAFIPDKMEFKSAIGPARFLVEGRKIVFEPLLRLVPKADAIFRVHVKALAAGNCLFKIQVTSTNLTEPVVKMESTRIYSDSPETGTGTSPGAAPVSAGGPLSGAIPGPVSVPEPVPGVSPEPAPTPLTVPNPAPVPPPVMVPPTGPIPSAREPVAPTPAGNE